jgi:hypothetical protein
MSAQPGSHDLDPAELVDDRELLEAADDQFGHNDFVDEIAQIVLVAQPPASVALFAPWGSGKSSIGRLLKPSVLNHASNASPPRAVRFLTLNAFRYGEQPLRRHLIGELAEGLLGTQKGRKFVEERVYRSVSRRHLVRPNARGMRDLAGSAKREFGTFLTTSIRDVRGFVVPTIVLLLFLLALMLVGIDIGAAVGGLIALLYALALFTAAAGAALLRSNLSYTSSRDALTSAEEFERAFDELLEQPEVASLDRVVVFIDELDRCAAPEVVGTLEAIRTFLEADRCVFVVAADHQVLEQALAEAVRQETPLDTSNPYYSAGNAYLDKIFQFQFTLPPVKPQQLSDFAFRQVRGAPGVWRRIPHLDQVISVLIPSHVDSPRRVKVLLNSFAIAYRIAERRVEQNVIPANLGERASELAKIVCLRCEFPLFARELSDDPEIVDAVHKIGVDGPDRQPEGVSDDLWRSAKAYASGSLPAIVLLGENREGESRDPADREPTSREVFATNARHLLAYLQKTRHVSIRGSDLVFLSTDTYSGLLAPATAERLRTAGLNGEAREALAAIRPLGEEERGAAVQSLAGLVRERPLGIQGRNAVGVLLQVVGSVEGLSTQNALRAVEAINTYPELALDGSQLAPSLKLALALPQTPVSRLLTSRLLQDARMSESPEVAYVLVAHHDSQLSDELRRVRAEAIAHCLVTGDFRAPLFAGQPDAVIAECLSAGVAQLHAQLEPPQVSEDEEDYSEQAAAYRARVETVASYLDSLIGDGETPIAAGALAAAMSATYEETVCDEVLKRREALSQDPGRQLSEVALEHAQNAPLAQFDKWLSMVSGEQLGDIEDLDRRLGAAAVNLRDRVIAELHPEDWSGEARAYLTDIQRIAESAGSNIDPGSDLIPSDLRQGFSTSDRLSAIQHAEELAQAFADAEILSKAELADAVLDGCVATLETNPDDFPGEHALVTDALITRIGSTNRTASKDALVRAMGAIAESEWIWEPSKTELIYAIASMHKVAVPEGVSVTTARLQSLIKDHGDAAVETVTLWLTLPISRHWREVATVVHAIAEDDLSEAQEQRVRKAVGGYSGAEKNDLVKSVITGLGGAPSQSVLRSLGWATTSAQVVTNVLTTLASEGARLDSILALWAHRGAVSGKSATVIANEILVPAVRSGVDANGRLVAQHLYLASKIPTDDREPLLRAIAEATMSDDVLDELRIKAEESSLIGKRRRKWPFWPGG